MLVPYADNRADYADYERALSLVRAQLDESTFTRLWQEGREMAAGGLDQVLAYARQEV